jgi:hypothetical protein
MSINKKLYAISAVLKPAKYKLLLGLVWFLVITLFLWLPQVNLLAYIFTQAPMDFSSKIGFFVEYYGRVLSGIGNPIIFSLVIFSILTALSIVLLVYMVRNAKGHDLNYHGSGKAYSGVAAAAVGSHILSCGGTLLLASLFPAFSSSSTIIGGSGVTINIWMSTIANLIGIGIVLYTINKLSKDISKISVRPRSNYY